MHEVTSHKIGNESERKIYILFDIKYNIDNMDKIKVQLDKDVVNELIKMKEVGDTYSDVIRRLLKIVKGKDVRK